MAKLTRRGLLKQATVGVGTVGIVAGVVAAGVSHIPAHASSAAPAVASSAASGEFVVAYIRDRKKGEVGILVGESEHVHIDHDLVNRLSNG